MRVPRGSIYGFLGRNGAVKNHYHPHFDRLPDPCDAHHYWPAIEMPSLFLQQFTFAKGQVYSVADHLGLSMAIRSAVVLLLPFAAQVVLEKTDI